MNALTIADVSIRTDEAGRFFLNDLHRAAGGLDKDKPNRFLRLDSTAELIAELGNAEKWASDKINHLAPVNVVNSFTKEQGTYVCKELVYSYAMWISPAFHLKVIRAYDAMLQAGASFDPANLSRKDILQMALESEEARAAAEAKVVALEHQVETLAPKAQALDDISAGDESLTITQAAKVLGVKRDVLTNWLHANGWVYRQNGTWVAYDAQIKAGRLRFKEARYTDDDGMACHRPYCHITPKGLTDLAVRLGAKVPQVAA